MQGESSLYYSKETVRVEPFFVAMSLKTFLVDLRIEARKSKDPIMSDFLAFHCQQTITAGNMVLLLLNRRGHARSLLCHACGKASVCPHCDISMTIHKEGWEQLFLLCHYCGLKTPMPKTCAACGDSRLKTTGIGIQQAEEYIRSVFPAARVTRMDADTMRGKDAYNKMYNSMQNGEIDIVIGTQMLAKGLDNPRVRLVGVLDADIGLALPDFRAEERTFQLLMQVLGRAGRQGDDSTVVIQTWMPEAPSIHFAATQDLEGFYEYLLGQRRDYHYPPFAKIIKLTLRAKTAEDAEKAASEMVTLLEKIHQEIGGNDSLEIMHAPAYIAKQQGTFVHHIILKGDAPRKIVEAANLPRTLKIDIDPMTLL